METITKPATPKGEPKQKMKKLTVKNISGAEAVVQSLLSEGVDLMYGYPGGANMPIYDVLYNYQKELHHVLTRHEQGAIHAAQGFARTSGKVGVCMATSGPGATNLITGLADAMIDSTPLVCITGQVASNLLGSDAFQETDINSMSTPVTKWNFQITKAEEIAEVFAKAFYIAISGRPGPVLIDITKDAQFENIDFHYKKCTKIRSYHPIPKVDMNQIKAAATLINSAKKPFILFGQGVILGNAEEEFKALIEKAQIPSASTLLGLSALPSQHKLNMGMVGMHGHYAPNVLTNDCDLLISVGMRFDDRVTGNLESYAKQAKVIHFDIDPSEIGKNVSVDVPVLGDVKETLAVILPSIEKKNHDNWIKKFYDLYQIEQKEVINGQLNPAQEKLTMGEVMDSINKETNGEAIIATDVGQHQMFAGRYANFKNSKSLVTSGGLGTMGFGLPAAIGAKMGAPDKEVVVIIGDGGFQMTIQELGTILQTKVPVKIVVLNNEFLGMVRQWQELFFDKRYASTVMTNPDFVKIVEGYGIKANRVTKREDLTGAVSALISSKESCFLEVVVEKKGLVFPMVPSGASVSDVRLK